MDGKFSLYKRGRTYYVQYLNPATGKYLPGRSTGKTTRNAAAGQAERWLEEGIPDPARGKRPVKEALSVDTILQAIRTTSLELADAERIVGALKDKGLLEVAVVKAGPGSEDFGAFLLRFWSEDSPYIAQKRAHGQRIGRRRTYDCTRYTRQHWLPYFKDKRLGQIRRADLEEFSMFLAGKKLAPKTVNNVLAAGTIPLRWATAQELIPANPAKDLMRFSGKAGRRGVLTAQEVARLFAVSWGDERARLANILSMSTGLRQGEVLAIQLRDIGEDRLHVRHSWSPMDGGLKAPKTNEERAVPLLATVRAALLEMVRKSPHTTGPSSFVFWSLNNPEKPMDARYLLDGLKAALLRLTLIEEDLVDPAKVVTAAEYWKSRRITYHGWRHFYAARLSDRVEQRAVMLSTGHASKEVFQVYADHGTAEQFQQVREAAEESFGRLIPFRVSGTADSAAPEK